MEPNFALVHFNLNQSFGNHSSFTHVACNAVRRRQQRGGAGGAGGHAPCNRPAANRQAPGVAGAAEGVGEGPGTAEARGTVEVVRMRGAAGRGAGGRAERGGTGARRRGMAELVCCVALSSGLALGAWVAGVPVQLASLCAVLLLQQVCS